MTHQDANKINEVINEIQHLILSNNLLGLADSTNNRVIKFGEQVNVQEDIVKIAGDLDQVKRSISKLVLNKDKI